MAANDKVHRLNYRRIVFRYMHSNKRNRQKFYLNAFPTPAPHALFAEYGELKGSICYPFVIDIDTGKTRIAQCSQMLRIARKFCTFGKD